MNWCALPHDMTYQGQPPQGQPPPHHQPSVQHQQPPPQPQLPPSAAALPPAKKPKAKANKESKPPMPPKPPKEPGAKRQRSKAAPGGSGGKRGKAEAGDELGAAEVLGGRPATPDPDLADPDQDKVQTANPALDSEVVVIHAGSRLLRVGLAGLHAPPPLLLPHCVAYRRAAAVATSAAACSASAREADAEAAEDDAAEASLGPLTRQLRAANARSYHHARGQPRLSSKPPPQGPQARGQLPEALG